MAVEVVPALQIVADVLVSIACIVYLVVDVRRYLREQA